MVKKSLTSLLILLLFPCFIRSEGSRGTSAATFLEMGVGSRSLAVGEAYTAWTEDLFGMYYNPAQLGTLRYPEVSFFHYDHITDSRLENMTGAFKLGHGYMGLGSTLFWVPSFEKVDVDGNSDGSVDFYNFAFNTAYGMDLKNFYVGANIKYVYEKIYTYTYNAAAVDIGILKGLYMYSPFNAPARNFYAGLSFQNFGSRIAGADLPRKLNLGLSYLPVDWIRVSADASEYCINMSDLYDFTYGFYESFQLKTGIEFSYLNLIFLRGGYRFNDTGHYTAGAGVNYSVGDFAFALDTSVSDGGTFGPVYSVNFSVKLIPRIVTVEDIRKANEYYRKGLKEYVADDLDSAIESFENTKEYNPYHKNIDDKIKDLKELKKIKKENEALEKQNGY